MQEQPKVSLIDIYEITYEPWWLSTWFKLSLIIAGLVILSAATFFLYRKYRKKVKIPYWQKTLLSISCLEKERMSDGEIVYVKLTYLLKDYFQHAYGIPLVDKTDTEMLEILNNNHIISANVYQEVKAIFDGVMFIKFAHQKAAIERIESDIKKSKDLIQITQQQLKKDE